MSSGMFQTTACKVALELGYTKKAIVHCYVNGMQAGELVSKILDLEESNPEFRNEYTQVESESHHELIRQVNALSLQDKNKNDLLQDTIKLWRRQQCHSCWRYKSNMLALPCTHLVICENCTCDKCLICKVTVTDWIKVHL